MQLCAFDGKLIPPIHRGAELLEQIVKLTTTARKAGIPVIFVQHCALEGQPYARGTHGWEIHPTISPQLSEVVVYKRQSSGFDGTDLQSVLAQRGIDTVIVCGIQSEFCVTNTSIAALERGLNVYVAQDAHGTLSTEEDEASVIVERQNALLSDRGARIQATNSLVELLTTN